MYIYIYYTPVTYLLKYRMYICDIGHNVYILCTHIYIYICNINT